MKLLSRDLGRVWTTYVVPTAETLKPIEQKTTTPCGQVVRIDLSHTTMAARRLEKTMAKKERKPQVPTLQCPECKEEYSGQAKQCKRNKNSSCYGSPLPGAKKKKATEKKATEKKATKKKATETFTNPYATINTNTFERQAAYRQEFFQFKREIAERYSDLTYEQMEDAVHAEISL